MKTKVLLCVIVCLVVIMSFGAFHAWADATNLTATPGDNQVVLKWNNDGGVGFLGFHVYRGTAAGRENLTLLKDVGFATTYTDTTVQNGVTYYYMVKAVYIDNEQSTQEISVKVGAGEAKTGGKTIVLRIGSKYMTVNGVEQEIDFGRDTAPVIKANRTLVPIRAIIEALGGTADWDGTDQKITVSLNNKVIKLWVNKLNTTVNGVEKTTDVAPIIINGRTMLPLRFITENLGCGVNWDGNTQKITVTLE